MQSVQPSTGEARLREWVRGEFPVATAEYNVRPDWLLSRKGHPLELDVWLPELRLAFEYQGWQHYACGVGTGVSLNQARVQRARDLQKAYRCRDLGVYLFGVTWDDLESPSRLSRMVEQWRGRVRENKRPGLMRVPPLVHVLVQGKKPFNPLGRVSYLPWEERPGRVFKVKGQTGRIIRRNALIDANSIAARMGWYNPKGPGAASNTGDGASADALTGVWPNSRPVRTLPAR